MRNPAFLYHFGLLFLRTTHVRVCDISGTCGSSLGKNTQTALHHESQQGPEGSLSRCRMEPELRTLKCMCVCDKKVSWEKQASDCLLGTNVCANHCQHFPFTSNHCSGNWITRWADGVLLWLRGACVYIVVALTLQSGEKGALAFWSGRNRAWRWLFGTAVTSTRRAQVTANG